MIVYRKKQQQAKQLTNEDKKTFIQTVVQKLSIKIRTATCNQKHFMESNPSSTGDLTEEHEQLIFVNNQVVRFYFFDYCLECTNLDDFKILKSDHYGLATLTNLNVMNNMINLNEQVENNEAPNNFRPSENYLNCYDGGGDSESSPTSSNSSDKDDVDLSIWNDKDSDIEYSSSDDDEEEEDNKLINKETE
ncbi:unnamed protein product [Rotaria sp. Silwood2]|nr:unnamed protein product [Rotaria sp. Silwood2]CAF4080113.1 unnamed protein product [Rotaria sp. Silwood2]